MNTQKIVELAILQILVMLDEKLQGASSDVLRKLIEEGSFRKKLTDSLLVRMNEFIDMAEFEVHKIASGQQPLPNGQKYIAGFHGEEEKK